MFSSPADPAFERKLRAPLSITTRLAALYAVSASAMLLATTVFLYRVQIQAMERDDFYFVVDKAYRLARAMQEHPEDAGFLAREVMWEGDPGEREQSHTFYARILDGQGRLVIETAGMATVVPGSQFPPPVASDRISKQDVVQRWRSPEGRIYHVLSVRARNEQNGQWWVIQVALADTDVETLVANLQRAALMALLFGIVVSAGLGGAIARRGMKPLREIVATTERITANSLNERIDPARQPVELAALATALNRMLGRLEDSYVRMSQFAADVAHELRTPIHNMRGEAEVALAAQRNPEEYGRILESYLEEFERLSRMINEMLFLARAENPRRQIERVRVDARREVEKVREFFDALAESRSVTVTVHGQCDMDADALLFRRALTNLLSNALRYTPSGGQVVVSVERDNDGAVLVKVSDSGCGIRLEHLPRICDRRYCAERTVAQSPVQSGLGLSIVKSIVELHGGSIEIDSAPGKGTIVLMRFPAASPAAASPDRLFAPGRPAPAAPQQSMACATPPSPSRTFSAPSGLQKT